MSDVLDRREAGVFAHLTSLPHPPAGGVLGTPARRFVDWVASAGLGVWQMLPTGPTFPGDPSPYRALSAFAGSARLVDLAEIETEGWLEPGQAASATDEARRAVALAAARERFERVASDAARAERTGFEVRSRYWLDDYALYRALRAELGGRPWWEWPAAQRERDPDALAGASRRLVEDVAQLRFEQFLFQRQWERLRAYAAERRVRLFGDVPIFVAEDSAEVWGRPELFCLDDTGRPIHVAGVPPDAFSDTGQRWGNPLYDWERMGAEGYRWWTERLRTALARYAIVRIDHFRGFESYWRIPAGSPDAVAGEWLPGPGDRLFEALRAALGPLPVVAEDLGIITPEVNRLRERLGFPGMKVLQFAFDGSPDNPYLPRNHVPDSVVYTGTHDNDTTLGWFRTLDEPTRSRVREELGRDGADMPWPLIECALASAARLVMVPLQDFLGLGSKHRMNRPGTVEGNWRWRFRWERVPPGLAARIGALLAGSERRAGRS